jgi:hypothetical protein
LGAFTRFPFRAGVVSRPSIVAPRGKQLKFAAGSDPGTSKTHPPEKGKADPSMRSG